MKMKKYLPVILTVLLVGSASAGGGYFLAQNQAKKQNDEAQNQIKDKEKQIEDLEKDSGSSGTGTKTATGIISLKGFFKIDLPQADDTISSPVRIKGWANVFEGEFQVRIKDASGKVLGTKSATASAGAPDGGTFDTTVTFTQPATAQQGTVEIYDLSQKDGSIDDIAKISVTLKAK